MEPRESSPSSKRTPTGTAPRASVPRSKPRARRCSPARTSRRACSLRDAGVTIPILVFGALSVSDLGGIFAHALTPTVSTPAAARALEAAAARAGVRLGCHLKIDTGMNRLGFRHDNLRRTMPDVLASRHLSIRRGLHAFRDRRRRRSRRFSTSSAGASTAPWRRSARWASRACAGTRPTRRRSCATPAPGTTGSGPACCSTASSRRRSRRPISHSDLPCHSPAVSWR